MGIKYDVDAATGNITTAGSITAAGGISSTSTTQGFLPPVMTTTQKNAIVSPATGLIVYDSTLGSLQEWNGSSWVSVGAPGGTNTQVQYNNNGALAGSPNLTFDGSVLNVMTPANLVNDGGGADLTLTSNGANGVGPNLILATEVAPGGQSFPLTGGSVTLTTGSSSADSNEHVTGGSLTITTGSSTSSQVTGGGITLNTGNSGSRVFGGSIMMTTGSCPDEIFGGDFTMTTGNETGNFEINQGHFILTTGNQTGPGGNNNIFGGTVAFTTGNSVNGNVTGPSLTLSSGTAGGTATGGNLTLTSGTPANGGSLLLTGTGSHGRIGVGTTTPVAAIDVEGSSGSITVDPTVPNLSITSTAGNGSNAALNLNANAPDNLGVFFNGVGGSPQYAYLSYQPSGNLLNLVSFGALNVVTNNGPTWNFGIDGGLVLPSLATEPGSPVTGEVIYQSTINKLEVWNGTAWDSFGGATLSTINLGYEITLPAFSDFGVATTPVINNLPNFSASCWINTNQFQGATPATYAITILGNVNINTADGGWTITLYNNGQIYANTFAPGASAQYAVLGTATLNDGKWHNIVVTYDSVAGFVFYVDGVLDPISNTPGPVLANYTTSNNFAIGNNPPDGNPANPSISNIALVQLWNTTLTASDAAILANGGAVPTSLIAKWDFVEGMGLTTADSIGGNTLTFTNLLWSSIPVISVGSNAEAAGSNTQIQFNSNGAFGADDGLSYTSPNRLTLGSPTVLRNSGTSLILTGDAGCNVFLGTVGNLVEWGSLGASPTNVAGQGSAISYIQAGNGNAQFNFTSDGAFLLPLLTLTQEGSLGTAATGTATVVNYANLSGAVLTINGITLTEGVDWNAAVSNDITVASIVRAILANTSTNCYALNDGSGIVEIISITAGTSGNSITLATSDGTNLPVSGATLAGGNFTPAESSMVWNSTSHTLDVYNGTAWTSLAAAGSNTQIQFNNAGAFGASPNLTWDIANSTLNIPGDGTSNNALSVGGTGTSTPVTIRSTDGLFSWGTSGASNLVYDGSINIQGGNGTWNADGSISVQNGNLILTGNEIETTGSLNLNSDTTNVSITANGTGTPFTWTFDSSGTLTTPGSVTINDPANSATYTFGGVSSPGLAISTTSVSNNAFLTLTGAAVGGVIGVIGFNTAPGSGTSEIDANVDGSLLVRLNLNAGPEFDWTFGANGDLTTANTKFHWSDADSILYLKGLPASGQLGVVAMWGDATGGFLGEIQFSDSSGNEFEELNGLANGSFTISTNLQVTPYIWTFGADATLTLAGGLNQKVTPASTTYTAASDGVIPADATGGAFSITLPPVSGISGRTYTIKKVDATVNAVTIQANGAETIDGTNTRVINTQWASFTIVCDGTQWLII